MLLSDSAELHSQISKQSFGGSLCATSTKTHPHAVHQEGMQSDNNSESSWVTTTTGGMVVGGVRQGHRHELLQEGHGIVETEGENEEELDDRRSGRHRKHNSEAVRGAVEKEEQRAIVVYDR